MMAYDYVGVCFRIELVAKGSPGSLKLIESATILPGVKIVIANPYTLQQCPDLKLGEVAFLVF